MSDIEIANKLEEYIKNNNKLETLRKKSNEWANKYTQEYYAQEFIKVLDNYFTK